MFKYHYKDKKMKTISAETYVKNYQKIHENDPYRPLKPQYELANDDVELDGHEIIDEELDNESNR